MCGERWLAHICKTGRGFPFSLRGCILTGFGPPGTHQGNLVVGNQSKTSGQFRFRKHDNIGAAAAEDDEQFLAECFEDNGEIDVILDCSNPKRIILGRTGAGKTALLMELAKRSQFVIPIKPEHLSLNYISNSTILPYLSSLGISLDPFYKLLWRHVFAVTIIQHRVDIVDRQKQKSFIDQCREAFQGKEAKAKRQQEARRTSKAIDYIERWGDRFFEDVEFRTKEVTERFENEVRKGVDAKFGGNVSLPKGPYSVGLSAGRESSSSQLDASSLEVRQEVIERAKAVVNEIQVQELGGILELLHELLGDAQKPCYITIDQLDEPWADDEIKLRLLKGLLDTVREFGKVHHAKVVICLRIDLVEQLFKLTRSEAGFQEDKYRSLYLPLRWTRNQIEELLDKRIARLVRDAYTNYVPKLRDLVPETMKFGRRKQIDSVQYILDRTWGRPRDAISFLNACILKSEGKSAISKDVILEAEGEYSRVMLRAIATEWHAEYPDLPEVLKALLTNRPTQFKLSDVTIDSIDDWSLAVACAGGKGEFKALATRCQLNEISAEELRREVFAILYQTGCVGLKTCAFSETRWATSESYSVSPAEIDDTTSVTVHPGLWKVLGITDE